MTTSAAAKEVYTSAYAAHYTDKDLHSALDLYEQLLSEFPESTEAEYARAQITTIANSIIPRSEHAIALLKLTRTWVGRPATVSRDEEAVGPWSSYTNRNDESPVPGNEQSK